MLTVCALTVRHWGVHDYRETWGAMRDFTESRTPQTPDEIWFLEHTPVFTLGRAGKWEHLVSPGSIPVVHVDRGGQVTYHGPGQLIVYLMLDLRRRAIGVRQLVNAIEQSVIDLLADVSIAATRQEGAPGIYVDGKKIGALGLRLRNRCSYHGLALNVNMDLRPFRRINPCGYPDLEVTQLADLGAQWDIEEVKRRLLPHLLSAFGENMEGVKNTGRTLQ